MLKIVSLGGLGHIGGNMMAVETETSLVLIDCGLLFPTEDQPGVDYVIPDVSFVSERQHKLRGIFLTHGHEDHIGALPYLWDRLPVPVYGSRFTLALVAAKLCEFPGCRPPMVVVADRETVQLGDIAVQAIAITHSIPGALALALTTPLGVLVHTGDFKLDIEPLDNRRTDESLLSQLGDAGVLALLSDSTNAEHAGHTYGEAPVAETLNTLLREAPFRVVVTAFASNIFRLRSIIAASEAAGRRVILAGRSMEQNVRLAIEEGYIHTHPHTICAPEDFSRLPRSGVTVLAGGTQGEPRSTLSRIALNQHGDIKLEPGDRVIFSSRRIPGNERPIAAVVNNLCRLDLDVIDDHAARVHASGHAFNDEHRSMLRWCRPRFFVPIHGEFRHLQRHARLAETCGLSKDKTLLIEDGQPLEFFAQDGEICARRGTPVTAGFVYVDGKRVGDIGEVVLRDRRVLAETGFVLCAVVLDETGQVVTGPHVTTRGLLDENDSQNMTGRAATAVTTALRALDSHADHATRANEIRLALRRFFRREIDRRPLVIPVVMTM